MHVNPQQLKSFLIDFGLVSNEEIKKAEEMSLKTGKDIEEILTSEKKIKEEDITRLKAYILGIPFINLEKEKIPLDVLKIIPEPIAKENNIVAYRKEGENLLVAMLKPQDLQILDFVRKKANLKILPCLTSPESIKYALSQYEESLEAEFGKMIKEEKTEKITSLTDKKEKKETREELEKAAEEMPIIKIVDTLLKHAVLRDASDIHIEPAEKELRVRYRIDGILYDTMILPRRIHLGIAARIKILANLKLDEHRLPQDGRFKIETEDYKVSFRVSILPTYFGEKIVMRLLPESSRGLTLEGLGWRGEALEKIRSNIERPYGLILVTGPTGCGKTTTLYTIMEILNTPEVNISTVEDPIEYTISRINQTQVRPEIGFAFANGLRSLLRQDPDMIMVGEIRDNETAMLAINAALTGHLVLSTLHTNNAAGAIPRLLDMKVEAFLIASTLKMVVAQRLVRKLCPVSEEYNLSIEEVRNLSKNHDMDKILKVLKKEKIVKPDSNWEDIKFARSSNTKTCPGGYKGRIGIYESFEISKSIRELILKEAGTYELQRQAEKEGMITMLEDGFIKAVSHLTTIEEILRVVREE